MNQKKHSPKDAKIIKENPGATLYELLEAGLSKKAYERLSAEGEGKLEPIKVEATNNTAVIRKKSGNGQFTLIRNLRTNMTTRVSSKVAAMLLQVYPNEYKTQS